MAAAAAAPQMMNAQDMQNLMMNPQLLQMFQQQQQLANVHAVMNGMAANMHQMPVGVGSDMMRRLQQEGHRAFQP